jgi:hypothetical protein
MRYWTNEKTIIKASHMSNAQGNQKKASKYGRGGKTIAKLTIVRLFNFVCLQFLFP